MAERLNVNPTRMELTKLKKQLKTAQRGHKLLKDKNDELMKRFLDIIRENKRLREEVEQAVQAAHQNFAVAKSVMSAPQIGEALMLPKMQVAVSVSQKNIMSVVTPVFDFHTQNCTQNCVQSGVKGGRAGRLARRFHSLRLRLHLRRAGRCGFIAAQCDAAAFAPCRN